MSETLRSVCAVGARTPLGTHLHILRFSCESKDVWSLRLSFTPVFPTLPLPQRQAVHVGRGIEVVVHSQHSVSASLFHTFPLCSVGPSHALRHCENCTVAIWSGTLTEWFRPAGTLLCEEEACVLLKKQAMHFSSLQKTNKKPQRSELVLLQWSYILWINLFSACHSYQKKMYWIKSFSQESLDFHF